MSRYRSSAVVTIPLTAIAFMVALSGALRLGVNAATMWPVVTLLAGLPAVALGNLVAARRSDHRMGALLAWTGAVVCAVGTVDAYALLGDDDRLPAADVAATLSQGVWVWLFAPVAFLMLHFPTGRLPGPRWWPVAVALPSVAAAFTLLGGAVEGAYLPPFEGRPHALGTLPPAFAPLVDLLVPVFMGLLIASTVSLLIRYRRAVGIVRTQLRWVAVAGLMLPGGLILSWAGYLLLGRADLIAYALVVLLWGLSTAVAVAVVRHDLYDIDRLLSATVTYMVVSACVVGVFAVATSALGILTGGGSPVTAALATAVSAAALTPVHRQVRGRVYRRLYPLRDRILEAIAALQHGISTGAARPEELASTLRAVLSDPELQVGYLPPGTPSLIDVEGRPVTATGSRIEVGIAGQPIGVLILTRPCPPDLSAEIARAAAPLVEIVALRLEVRAALADAESSRGRLLRAGYEERRKIVHDLHDGSQLRLVSLGVALRLAQRHLPEGSVDIDGLLDQSVAELGAVVAELRALANGLRPSCLDDGLDAAIRQLTATVPLRSDLDLRAGRLADDVITTAYFVASEAVANVVKHSDAVTLAVTAVQQEGTLEVRVSDDGRGGAALRSGHGLSGLADRVSACGGNLSLHSPPGSGTVIRALLPCGS